MLLDAHLIAALQIIVYAGAIMVLFLFVIMLLNLQSDDARAAGAACTVPRVAGGAACARARLVVAGARPRAGRRGRRASPAGYGETPTLARALFTDLPAAVRAHVAPPAGRGRRRRRAGASGAD